MTPVIVIAISLLGAILTASFVALLLICTKHKCGKVDLTVQRDQTGYKKQDVELVGAKLHTGAVMGVFSPGDDLPDMFLDPDWSGDAENLISHCIGLLKSCHILTERLVAHTMEGVGMIASASDTTEIMAVAKGIGQRVDELVAAMYTPSDSRQIAEKSTALHECVCLLLQVVRSASKRPDTFSWAYAIIDSMEKDMEAMQNDCQSVCSSSASVPSSTRSSASCLCQQPMVSVTNEAYCYSLKKSLFLTSS